MNLRRCFLVLSFLAALAISRSPGVEVVAEFDRTESPYFFVRDAKPGDLNALELSDTHVDVTIAGMIAEVAIRQTYTNRGSTTLDAAYTFPASTRAAVHGLTMRIADRVVEAEIQTRQKARRTFAQAKTEGRTATLLEQHRPNVFQMYLAHILPGDVVQVELRYTELLEVTDGTYEFVFPVVVAPRYSGDPAADALARALQNAAEGSAASPVVAPAFGIEVEIAAGVPLASVTCASHAAALEHTRADYASVRLPRGEHSPRDFILHFSLVGDVVHSGLVLSGAGTPESPGYFLALVQPPARPRRELAPPRDYVFVVDVSGSMNGFPLDTAKDLMAGLLTELRDEDTFNVVTFAGGSSAYSATPLRATPENLAKAIVMLDRETGGGGTNLLQALETVAMLPRREALSRTVVVVTDGHVTVEAEAFDFIRSHLDQANVFAFGIGPSVNRHLIESLARAGLGEPFIVTDATEAPATAARFHRYIADPVLTQVRATTENFAVHDMLPEALPDVFAQRPVMWCGRWIGDPGRGRIQITGTNGDGAYARSLAVRDAVRLDADARVLELLWARQKISALIDREAVEPRAEFVEAITQLGLRHGLLTPYTSFVAVDRVARPAPANRKSAEKVSNNRDESEETTVPATPEPATWGMLGLTLLAVLWLMIRHRRSVPVTSATNP